MQMELSECLWLFKLSYFIGPDPEKKINRNVVIALYFVNYHTSEDVPSIWQQSGKWCITPTLTWQC